MPINLKPDHKAVRAYYTELAHLTGNLNAQTEGSVSPLFAALLRHCAPQMEYTLVEQHTIKRGGQNIRVDGALMDAYHLIHGLWEAKDSSDDLDREIEKKVAKGYPRDNILFQAPSRAVLYQDNQRVMDADLTKPEQLIDVLKLFFDYEPPAFAQWGQAVEEFKVKVPELGEAVLKLIEEQRQTNPTFVRAFDDFTTLVKESINPNISTKALEEMLIQHLLTERIFRKIFNNPDFANRNIIAREIEKVIQALTSRSFSRDQFLGSLDRFYVAIEETAASISDYTEKQAFLNTVYEKFFQGFSVKAADVYGIVYTPQPIVNFMINSVEHILQEEFGRSLSDENVHIIDPFVGTGNFIINIMRKIQRTKLPFKYANELHCNEVMLLPYYIASMNIEHAYFELTGTYQPFEGICLVDTFDINEQMTIFGHENTERIAKQRNAPIFVVIANPPYNAGQVNENDNNKNRKYPLLDKRISDTYGKASSAQLVRKLNDPYIKAIRWATDRIGDEGIVVLVTNNSFLRKNTFDGMRKYLESDFSSIYILNLGGNVRENPNLSGSTNNVFGIQIGVSINIFIKKHYRRDKNQKSSIKYMELGEYWTKEEKYSYLEDKLSINHIEWETISPDKHYDWFSPKNISEFDSFIPLFSTKNSKVQESIFISQSLGVATNRDVVVYNFHENSLARNVLNFVDNYNLEINRYMEAGYPKDIDAFVNYKKIKWSSTLKNHFIRLNKATFTSSNIVQSIYRPYTKQFLYYEKILVDRPAHFSEYDLQNNENLLICLNITQEKPFICLATNLIPELVSTGGFGSPTHAFPFFITGKINSTPIENITDWALAEFQKQYNDPSITKWDIFYYVYGYLHHPDYRSKYAANLRRELPRLPFAPDFWAFSKAGKALADLHVNYESQPQYPLTQVENPLKPLDWRVEKMKLSADKTALIYNDFLTLTGIPAEVYEYKLGNRSALEWIVDQYRVKTDPRSGIVNDPNNPEDPEYIVRLIKQIVHVSLETVKIVKGLPEKFE